MRLPPPCTSVLTLAVLLVAGTTLLSNGPGGPAEPTTAQAPGSARLPKLPSPPPFALHLVAWAGDCQFDLGSWAKADGLDVAWDIAEYRAGDNANHSWLQPGKTKSTAIKLTRTASEDSRLVQNWLDDFETTPRDATLIISLLDEAGNAWATWQASHVLPVKWSITGVDAGASKLPVETLEFTHMGFLDDAVPCSAR